MNMLIAIDVETTGLNPRDHAICQFGATVFQLGAIHDTKAWDVHVSPHHIAKAEPKALEVNGFTEERMLAGIPMWRVLAEFEEWCHAIYYEVRSAAGYAKPDVTWGAAFHNAPFDVGFIRSSGFVGTGSFVDLLLRRVLDTVTMGWMRGENDGKSLSLAALADGYLFPSELEQWQSHDAGSDSWVTARLVQELYGCGCD